MRVRMSECDQLTEHSLISEVFHDKPDASWKYADKNVQVKEEGRPRGGLVLRHAGYDGDVDLGIPESKEVNSKAYVHVH